MSSKKLSIGEIAVLWCKVDYFLENYKERTPKHYLCVEDLFKNDSDFITNLIVNYDFLRELLQEAEMRTKNTIPVRAGELRFNTTQVEIFYTFCRGYQWLEI